MASTYASSHCVNRSIHHTPVAFLEFEDTRSSQELEGDRIELWDHQIFKIGRHAGSNNFTIEGDSEYMVSRNHCELYTVVYEPGATHVYVRDRKSINGTYVNNVLVGAGPAVTPGYLLQNGDVIEIRPHWKFIFHETRTPTHHGLTNLQAEECQLFADKYQLTNRCLGQGAEASVYLALDPHTKKQIVCKVVNLDNLQGRHEHLRRKYQEVDILRQLQHPNILTYVDAIMSPHSLYTFTELASGGDLMSFLYRYDQVAELDARIIIRQIVRALHYLHSKGIVHRDLKPENVLLAYSSRIAYHRVVLSDFGTSAVPHRSRMMTFVGTMQYHAPELKTRAELQTTAVDVWSLGLIALLLVTPKHDIPNDLNCLDQSSLNSCLAENIENFSPRPSPNAVSFIWNCLRVSPEDRINTNEAGCHDWLCTPEKHLEFFRRFDERMMADWSMQRHLKPIPWELESLKDALEQPNKSFLEEELGRKSEKSKPMNAGSRGGFDQVSGYFSRPDPDENDISLISIPARFNPPPSWGHTTGAAQVHDDSKRALIIRKESPVASSSGLTGHRQKAQTKKRRTIKPPKIPDSLFLPLTGLDRHLRPAPSGVKRERILDELKKTSSMFLKDGIPPEAQRC